MAERIARPRAADTPLDLEPDEKVLRDIRSDRDTYLRNHGVMALIGMVLVGAVLWLIGSEHIVIGALGAVLALAVRGVYLYSEQMKFHWVLTDRRLIGPGGRNLFLLEIETVRRLLSDIQVITRAGDKHLIKHIADSDAVVTAIKAARAARGKSEDKGG